MATLQRAREVLTENGYLSQDSNIAQTISAALKDLESASLTRRQTDAVAEILSVVTKPLRADKPRKHAVSAG